MSYYRSVGADEAMESIRTYLEKEQARELRRREEQVMGVVEKWLPKYLRFLANHPRLLKLWIKLPHSSRVVIHHYGNGKMDCIIVKRSKE